MDFRKLKPREYNAYIKELKQIYKKPKKYRARSKNPLPEALLEKHPELSEKQIKLIRNAILYARGRKLRGSWILDFTVPHIGRTKTNGNRIKSWIPKLRVTDRRRKRELTKAKQMTREALLW